MKRLGWKLDMMHPKNLCYHHYVLLYTNSQPLRIHQIGLYSSMLLPLVLAQKETGKECLLSAECNPTVTYQKAHSLSWPDIDIWWVLECIKAWNELHFKYTSSEAYREQELLVKNLATVMFESTNGILSIVSFGSELADLDWHCCRRYFSIKQSS